MSTTPLHTWMMLNFYLQLILFLFQGGYVWLNVNSNDEFDVPIGVKILGTEGKNIRIQDDSGEVCVLYTVNERYHRIDCKPVEYWFQLWDGLNLMSHQILMMRTEMAPETSVKCNQLTQLIAEEDFINFSHCKSFRSYKISYVLTSLTYTNNIRRLEL
jgi:hypothetical protein